MAVLRKKGIYDTKRKLEKKDNKITNNGDNFIVYADKSKSTSC